MAHTQAVNACTRESGRREAYSYWETCTSSGWSCVSNNLYVATTELKRVCVHVYATSVTVYASADVFFCCVFLSCLPLGAEACLYACCVSVYLPGASDGKHWLYSNARVVRKPAGSLVLATAGGSVITTIKPASVSNREICHPGQKGVVSTFHFTLSGPQAVCKKHATCA